MGWSPDQTADAIEVGVELTRDFALVGFPPEPVKELADARQRGQKSVPVGNVRVHNDGILKNNFAVVAHPPAFDRDRRRPAVD
jgi:hypothetical protein